MSKSPASAKAMLRRDKSFVQSAPMLYLVGTPIGNIKDVSDRAREVLAAADIIASEDTRNTAFLLRTLGLKAKRLVSCYAQKERETGEKLIAEIIDKKLVLAFVSDAGNPGISDPGALLCSNAIAKGVPVSVVLGPSAFVQALIVSGFDTSDFSFFGFPPAKEAAQKQFFGRLADRSETLAFYESPHRIIKTLKTMATVFGPKRRAVAAREMTKIHEEYLRGTLEELAELPSDAVRGEFVIVVEGLIKSDEVDEAVVEVLLENSIKAGMTVKEAVAFISQKLKVGKNKVYTIANRFKEKIDGGE